MHPLEKETLRLISSETLFCQGEGVVVGVSGGPDSMALLHIMHALEAELSITVFAAFFDHGLRPLEAGEERALVVASCARMGIQLACAGEDVKALALREGLSLEHAGRVARYAFFDEVLARYGAAKIALAHTADDQAEEVLLRFIRGAGRKGLSGMDQIRDGRIVRPFLNIAKETLLSYLADKRIDFRIDSSNLERTFLRNRIRLDLIPYLEKEFNPKIGDALRRTAAILREEEAVLEKLADEAVTGAVVFEPQEGAGASVRLAEFFDQPVAIRRRVLERVFWKLGVKPDFRKIEHVLHVAESVGEGAVSHHAEGLRVEKKRDRLVFSFPQGRGAVRGNLSSGEEIYFTLLIEGPGTYVIVEIGKEIEISLSEVVPVPESVLDDAEQYFDAAHLLFPLTIRNALPGDRFRPLGYPGSKKAASFFIDRKVPRSERRRYPVLETGERIAALLGLRIDHDFRITNTTKQVVRLAVRDI